MCRSVQYVLLWFLCESVVSVVLSFVSVVFVCVWFLLSKCCEGCVRVCVAVHGVCGVLMAWCVQVKRMIRGIGNMLFSTYSQTLNV